MLVLFFCIRDLLSLKQVHNKSVFLHFILLRMKLSKLAANVSRTSVCLLLVADKAVSFEPTVFNRVLPESSWIFIRCFISLGFLPNLIISYGISCDLR